MPLSIGIPVGLLVAIIGIFAYLLDKRKNRIWLGITILGLVITLATIGLIALAINYM